MLLENGDSLNLENSSAILLEDGSGASSPTYEYGPWQDLGIVEVAGDAEAVGDFTAAFGLDGSFAGAIDATGTIAAEFALDQGFAGSKVADADFASVFGLDAAFAGSAPAMPGVGEFVTELGLSVEAEGTRESTAEFESGFSLGGEVEAARESAGITTAEFALDAAFTGSAPAMPGEGAFASGFGLSAAVHTQRDSAGAAEFAFGLETHFTGYHESQSSFAVGFALGAEFAGPVTIPTGDEYYIFQTSAGYYAFQTS